MQPTRQSQSKLKLAGIVIAIVVVAGVILIADYVKAHDTDDMVSNPNATSIPTTQQASSTSNASVADTTNNASASNTTATTSAYKDGTYSAASSYYVPHGNESIQVNLTLKSGVVTDVSVINSEGDRDSALYQQDFASMYKSYVVGKSINGLKIGVIAGASDTTAGFNNALSQIEAKAQA